MMGALLCPVIICESYAQTSPDMATDTFKLKELTVKARRKISRAESNILLPPKAAVEASVNGRDLIGRMRIPRVSLNPLTGEIGMAGGGKVTITINGQLASSADLAAVAPADIIRVEHIDNPGPRYPDTQVLLNVVTRRHTSGGTVSADLLNTFKDGGQADIDNIALSYSHGRSQLTYSGQLMHLRRDNWARDYVETRVSPVRTVTVTETGSPSRIELANIANSLTYSLAGADRYLFSAKMGLTFDDVPHSEEADRSTIRTSTDAAGAAAIYEHMGERSLSPSLDLYGRWRFSDGSTFQANVVGTYIRSSNDHVYRQTPLDGDITMAADGSDCPTTISSSVKGRKYSLISEAGYNRQWGRHKAEIGMRHYQAYAANAYMGDVTADVSMRQAESSLYGRYSVTLGKVGVMASAGVTRYYNSQGGMSGSQVIFTPSAALSWTPADDISLRYRVQMQGKMPSLADMNDVYQEIDPGYLRRGNPGLKAYRVLDQELGISWRWRWLAVDVAVPFSHEYNPIMESVIYDGAAFVRQAANQRSFTHIGGEATVTLTPWKDYITLSITPSVDRYISRGNDFCCSHTLHNLRIDAEICYHHWQLSYNTLTGYANYMYGTRLMKERNMSMIMAGYKTDAFSVKVGVIDPFIKKYWMETRDMAPLLNSVSKAYSNRPAYLAVQLSLNLSYGRHTGSYGREIENTDTGSTLLKGVK